ncbi:MAG: cytochrome P450, partial [Steroidobacteraceae bacterium]|nr:cytochrome P450 [Steroidobacteraceae bacterium]
LAQHPAEWARLKADPALLSTAIDEMLRWVSPVNTFMRTATRDYELRGKTIRAGESVLLPFASANRDEDVFAEPFTFKVDRKPNPHIAFGFGAHACLGQHLAKMELRAFFREFLARVESFEVVTEPTINAIPTAYQIRNLPIRYRMN